MFTEREKTIVFKIEGGKQNLRKRSVHKTALAGDHLFVSPGSATHPEIIDRDCVTPQQDSSLVAEAMTLVKGLSPPSRQHEW